MLKSLVVKLKKESTIKNHTNPLSRVTAQRVKLFLMNVRGVVFYAVPHAGSSIPRYVKMLLRCKRHYIGLIENIRPCQQYMEQL